MTVQIPSYMLAAPEVPAEAIEELDAILETLETVDPAAGDVAVDLTDSTERPIWQLLVRAAASGRFALHGSGADDIAEFEPRQSNDTHEFGNRKGVYAAADGLWPYYFAIVDRPKIQSLMNAAVFLVDPDTDADAVACYFFSIASDDPEPWRDGTIYLLPINGFERQPEMQRPEGLVRSTQLFRPDAVRPVARVSVRPEGFPFLAQIRRHGEEHMRRAAEDPDGFPWL